MDIGPIDQQNRLERTESAIELRGARRAGETQTRLPVPEEPAPGSAPEDSEKTEKARGVIRLLEAGHFSGVADVRLRINFFDELANRASAARASVLQEGADNVVATVRNGVTELLASAEFDAESQESAGAALGDFESGTRALLEEGLTEGPTFTDSLRDAMTPIFDTLVTSLAELLAADTEDSDPSVVDEAAPQEPREIARPGRGEEVPTRSTGSDETVVPFDQALADLRAAFEDAVAALIASLGSVSRLPDPSPPSGNGGAFEKFLEVYNGLRQHLPEIDEES